MGAYDPTVIAVSVGIAAAAVLLLIVAAYLDSKEEEPAPIAEPEPVLTDDEHFAAWEQQLLGDEEWQARSAREARLLDPHRGWMP
jgi:hypothetical protein